MAKTSEKRAFDLHIGEVPDGDWDTFTTSFPAETFEHGFRRLDPSHRQSTLDKGGGRPDRCRCQVRVPGLARRARRGS
ncbi:MAG: hypothetical protein M3O70_16875 [Actinomycetota bacterium]|nr:hypothetical protein [Actinomycetota bacterium]